MRSDPARQAAVGFCTNWRSGLHASKHGPKFLVCECECAGDVMLCCQQAEAKSDLDCKQHSWFCFYVLYSSNGTRLCQGGCSEILCKPISRRCGGNPEWNPWCPCASIQEMWSRANFIFCFISPLFAIVSLYLWGVLNLYTLRTVAIHVDSAEGFLKVLKVASCVVVILWPSTHENQIS